MYMSRSIDNQRTPNTSQQVLACSLFSSLLLSRLFVPVIALFVVFLLCQVGFQIYPFARNEMDYGDNKRDNDEPSTLPSQQENQTGISLFASLSRSNQ